MERFVDNPDIVSAIREVAFSCAAACKAFFPERFPVPFSPSHHQIFQILDDDSIQFAAIGAPRGWGKSSIVQLGFPAQRILCRKSRFIMPISCTDKQAKEKSETLKQKLRSSKRIRELFPPMKSPLDSQEWWRANNPFFDAKGNKTCEGTLVLPRSVGQQTRGFLNEDARVDLRILDDLEDKESVMSADQRQKIKQFVFEDVIGTRDASSKDDRTIAIGTVLHEDSLLTNLLDDPNWVTLRLELCDDELHSNWPDRFSDEDVKNLYNFYLGQGLISSFYREYRNICQAPDEAPLKGPYQFYDPIELVEEAKHIEYMVVVDPAKSSNPTSCDTAIVCAGFNRRKNRVYVVDMIAERLHPEQQIIRAVAMAELWKAKVLGVEIQGIDEYATWPWESYLIENRCNIIFEPLHARKGPSQYVPKNSSASDHGKDARISAALVPSLRQGLIFFNKNHQLTPKLLDQMTQFPMCKRKDLIDALAHVFGLMSRGDRYLSGKEIKQGELSSTAWLDEKREVAALKKLLNDAEEENMQYSSSKSYLRRYGVN